MPGTLSAPHRRRRHARAAALAVVAALALAGCSTMPPSPSFPPPTSSPTGPGQTPGASLIGPVGSAADPSAVYAAIAAQVEQIRGLQPTAGIAPAVIDQATLTTDLTAEFDKSNPPASIAHSQAELVMLGLLPAGADLRATSSATTRPTSTSCSS
jgi:hypothetical protein